MNNKLDKEVVLKNPPSLRVDYLYPPNLKPGNQATLIQLIDYAGLLMELETKLLREQRSESN